MPYFFILPAFLVAELLLLAVLVATLWHPRLHHLRPLVVGVLVWATLGFLLANALLLGVTLGTVALADRTAVGEWSVVKFTLAALLFLGPFVASAAGAGAGGVFAWRRAKRATDHAA